MHRSLTLRGVFLFALLLMLPLSSAAQPAEQPLLAHAARPGGLDAQLSQQSGPVGVMVELEDVATTRVFAVARTRGTLNQATSAAQAQLARIERTQQQLLTTLAQFDAKIISRTQRVYNGIAIRVDATKLPAIRQLPGVKAIYPLESVHHTNSNSVPLIGTPQLWEHAEGLTGEGMTIAIIDSGIDYTHADFGGSGNADDFEANDPAVIEPGSFPTAKVIGGIDTVDNDADPLDCNSHGTHVAGTAAGFGINADGTTYTGPYTAGLNPEDFLVGPGVAPEASLVAVRVLDCTGSGSSEAIVAGIEYAIDPNRDGNFGDAVDVINMSLGHNMGSPTHPMSIASNNAAAAGTIVVAAAGNAGDIHYIAGSPANADWVISVAASGDDAIWAPPLQINTPVNLAGNYIMSAASFGPTLDTVGAITNTLVLATDAADESGPSTTDGCSPLNNAAEVSGKIALVDRGTCFFTTKVKYAQEAGAIAVIVVNNTTDLPFSMPGDDPTITIPAVMIGQDDGTRIKAELPTGVNGTLWPEPISFPGASNTVASFTSRGPRLGDSMLKPDVTAPGNSIVSAAMGTGSEGRSGSGTSMAAPHVAGAMTLLRQHYPDWSVAELKALIMNTATTDLFDLLQSPALPYAPARIGAGQINLPNAVEQNVIAYRTDTPELVSLSFGMFEVASTLTLTRSLTIENNREIQVIYNLNYIPVTTVPGVSYLLSQSQVTVAPGTRTDVTVTLQANPSEMRHVMDPTQSAEQGYELIDARHYLSEASGYVTLTPDGASDPNLRVPVYAAMRAASDMHANWGNFHLDADTGTAQGIGLAGTGLNTGDNPPQDELSLVSAFELQMTSPALADSSLAHADLHYIGITSDIHSTNTGTIEGATLYFGIATYGSWSTPNQVEFDIYIDTNGSGLKADGTGAEFLLYNAHTGDFYPNDVFVSVLVDLSTDDYYVLEPINVFAADSADTVVYNSNIMVLAVPASFLGLNTAQSRITYGVITYDMHLSGMIDGSSVLTYDAAHPGITFSGSGTEPFYHDLPATTISTEVDQNALAENSTQGMLLLHHHNRSGDRAEVFAPEEEDFLLYLPLVRK